MRRVVIPKCELQLVSREGWAKIDDEFLALAPVAQLPRFVSTYTSMGGLLREAIRKSYGQPYSADLPVPRVVSNNLSLTPEQAALFVFDLRRECSCDLNLLNRTHQLALFTEYQLSCLRNSLARENILKNRKIEESLANYRCSLG